MKKLLLIVGILMTAMAFLPGSKDTVRKEKAFEAFIGDSIQIQVDMAYSPSGKPHYYTSHVRTPVCKDTLCYLVVIDLYWDLLGNFQKYEVPSDKPLTKFDHDPFTEEDHKKLSAILANKTSLLRDYDMKALVDDQVKRSSSVVDATTGATSTTIRDEVVGGALYTTHTLWHIVNGPVARQILEHTEARFTDSLLVQMLRSDQFQYQFYALNRIPSGAMNTYLPHLVRLVEAGDSYVPYFAIEKLPGEVWKQARWQKELASLVGRVDFEMQNELLNKLKEVPLQAATLDALTQHTKKLTDQQVIRVLGLLRTNQTSLRDESLMRLAPLLDSPVREVATLTHQIFRQKAETDKKVKKLLDEREKG
ncbi:hypothetical protein [Telluribacter sp. SYSU D00476]|uniref:hypothetical protein n=1 Tax=Telluribacter sp. SYSU D00476 TaxID=2811430 RepID=UPI001FF49614|nr:hypothetical protein [Telluribacter sp. SYSU D00476]